MRMGTVRFHIQSSKNRWEHWLGLVNVGYKDLILYIIVVKRVSHVNENFWRGEFPLMLSADVIKEEIFGFYRQKCYKSL